LTGPRAALYGSHRTVRTLNIVQQPRPHLRRGDAGPRARARRALPARETPLSPARSIRGTATASPDVNDG